MTGNQLPISSKYRKPIFAALGEQLVLGIIFSPLLDGGQLAKLLGIAVAAFWIGVLMLIIRNRHNPSQLDISLIRFGTLPLLLITLLISKIL